MDNIQSTDAISSTGVYDQLLALKQNGLTFADCVMAFGQDQSDPYVAAAHEKAKEGELEVDELTIVSHGDDPGAYVMSWLWVTNQEAGLMPYSAMLEQVHTCAHRHLLTIGHVMDAELWALRSTQVEWLEELISNFADELDDIEEAKVKNVPGAITWVNGCGKEVRFMPSDALNQLRLLARSGGLPDNVAKQGELFCNRYGNKLDAILTAV